MTRGALDGLRVVEVGRHIAGPFCARLLADLGADVLKVEPPGGDPSRSSGPFANDVVDPEESGLFHYLNAGKRGATLDLDDASGADRLHGLLADADILVENLEPSERSRLGLGFAEIEARHPRLVAVSLSPYGRTGPWAERPGCDLTAQAASSLPLGLGSEDRSPLRIPYDQGDYQAAFHGAAAALCAIRERSRSGRGQGVDISAAQVMGYLVGGMHNVAAKNGNKWARRGTLMGGAPYPTGFFTCKDGFVCIASTTPAMWEKFLSLMDNPKWAKEENARQRDLPRSRRLEACPRPLPGVADDVRPERAPRDGVGRGHRDGSRADRRRGARERGSSRSATSGRP